MNFPHRFWRLEQAVRADFMTDGHFTQHVRHMRDLYAERQQYIVAEAKKQLGDNVLSAIEGLPHGFGLAERELHAHGAT